MECHEYYGNPTKQKQVNGVSYLLFEAPKENNQRCEDKNTPGEHAADHCPGLEIPGIITPVLCFKKPADMIVIKELVNKAAVEFLDHEPVPGHA